MCPCIHFAGGIVSITYAYRYKGFYFEWHSYFGPSRLTKEGNFHRRPGQLFYDVAMEWSKLLKEEKEKTRV
jgi:hypothetical protein